LKDTFDWDYNNVINCVIDYVTAGAGGGRVAMAMLVMLAIRMMMIMII
jgi:hypothetical protein